MGGGKGCALRLCLIFFLCKLLSPVQATNHTVGGALGWTLPSEGYDYQIYFGSAENFYGGDILLFNYDYPLHNVIQFGDAVSYYNCDTSYNALDSDAYTSILLPLEGGIFYFGSSIGDDCLNGMQFYVVADALSSAPPTNDAPPSPSPALSPPSPVPTPPSSVPTPPSSVPTPPSSVPTPPSTLPAGTTHLVGDDAVWKVPSKLDFYSAWAAKQSFKVGDSLSFQFTAPFHNVVLVSDPKHLLNCDLSKPSNTFLQSNAVVALTNPGSYYIACGVGNHCSLGMKFAINVVDHSSTGGRPGGLGSGASRIALDWTFSISLAFAAAIALFLA